MTQWYVKGLSKLTQVSVQALHHFSQELKTCFTEDEKKSYENAWDDIVSQVNESLDQDPESTFGIALGKRCMDWVNSVYSSQHVGFRP